MGSDNCGELRLNSDSIARCLGNEGVFMKKITIPGLFNASLASYVVADCPMTDVIYSYANNPLVTARFQPLKHKSLLMFISP